MSAAHPESLRIIIAGGGTGGHVFPAIAIREAVGNLRPDARIVFVGTRRGLEYSLLPPMGERLVTLWISGFSRRHLLKNLLLPLKLVSSFLRSLWLLITFRPQVVIGTGGYVMGPVLWLAQRLGIPTLLQEQNSHPGYTTRKLAKRAAVVCAGFADTHTRLPRTRVECTGNPLRSSFQTIGREQAMAHWGLDPSRKTILIFGGSAGARTINEAVAQGLEQLTGRYNLIWQTGRLGVPQAVNQFVLAEAHRSNHIVVHQFIHEMPRAYAAADVAVCRAGAMTLAELAVSGVPAILVPYPFATDDHQTANANAFVQAGAAIMVRDADLTGNSLVDAIHQVLQSENTLSDMRNKMKSQAHPEAAQRIAEIALTIAGKA